jgi:hypothetical protein
MTAVGTEDVGVTEIELGTAGSSTIAAVTVPVFDVGVRLRGCIGCDFFNCTSVENRINLRISDIQAAGVRTRSRMGLGSLQ